MRQKIGRVLAVSGMVMWLALPGVADMPAGTISGFNATLQTNDPSAIVAAAKEMGAVAIAHPEDPQAPVAAFEAANQLCLRGACADAVPMAQFLKGLAGGAPVSQPELDVLAAYTAWSASTKGPADDGIFQTALTANVAAQPSLLTIAAFETFYARTTQSSDWKTISARAGLAASHLEPVKDLVPDRWATAELLAATAGFNDTRDFAAYDRISDLSAWLQGKRRDEALEERLKPLAYEAVAWETALSAFFKSFGNTAFSNVDRDGRLRYQTEFDQAKARSEAILARFPTGTSSEPPFCSGEVVKPPKPKFPSKAARKGYVGAVLLGIDFEDGQVSNVEVLAAIPDDSFAQATLEGMKTFRWKFDEVQEEPGCTRTKKTAMVYPFEYVLR